MEEFLRLKKNLKKDFSKLKEIKIAVLGDTATQFLTQALRGAGFEKGLSLQIWEADFSQIERQVLDPTSELYKYSPEIILLFLSSHKLLSKYNKLKREEKSFLSSNEMSRISNIYLSISKYSNSKIIYYNYTEIDDSVLGSYSTKTESSFLFQLRKLNYDLMHLAISNNKFYLCDLSSIQNEVGKNILFRPSIYVSTEMVMSIDVLPKVAFKTIDIINALYGKIIKCVILDLDNTIWGGVIGDDGLEKIQIGGFGIGKAFSEFQQWIKKLKERGIIVAVCSKNTESIAKEPFEKHPDMVLKLDDIAVFVANWENKVSNIRYIKNILNIGFDSMVFLDDNPFERNLVRENIPEICVPELPKDPADYLEYLYSLNLFETVNSSKEDADRTKLYQIEAKRIIAQQQFANEDDYLQSLQMYSMVEPFSKFNIPRVAQLSQRSNQYNLRTVRYTESELANICMSDKYFTFSFTLEDKYGDNGLICVVILKIENKSTLFFDAWFMSCRVLKRGMENFVINVIAKFAKKHGFAYLKGEYIPTPKNGMVKDHFQNLGFINEDNHWILPLVNYSERTVFIKIRK